MAMARSLERTARNARTEGSIRAALAACAVLIGTASACRRAESPAPPLVADVSGTHQVPGLSWPGPVVRDRWGGAHTYAPGPYDRIFAEGFIHAHVCLLLMNLC